MTLDIQKLTTISPLLHGDGMLPISEAAKVIGLSDRALLSELLHDRAAVYIQVRNWPGWYVSDLDDIEQDHDATFVWNDVERRGTLQRHTGLLCSYDGCAALSGLIAEGAFAESVFLFPGGGAFFVDPEQVISLPACMVSKSAIQGVRARLARGIPPEHLKPSGEPTTQVAGTPGPLQPPPAFKHSGKRFSELFELYRNHRKWGEDQKRRMATEAGLFIELMGDPTLGEIELETVHEYATRLCGLPNDVYQSRRRFKVESLQDLMAVAVRESMPRKSEKTVRNHVGRIAEVLNFAVEKGMMPANPASGFQREWSVGKKARPQDERDAFDADELNLIFSQEWFAQGAGAFSANGATHWRPFYFWLPLLALITGGRLNELAQLYLDDIRRSEDGAVWYIDFNMNEPDKIAADEDDYEPDKSLKTVNSIRVVPLHEIAVRARLHDYVAALRKAGHVRLFPELTRDRVKGYGKPAGSWFNERFLGQRLGVERNGRKTFHSLRHNFATAVERLDLPERVMAQLLGHERGRTQSGSRYAKDRSAAELKPVTDRLVFPCIADVGRFDIPAAMKALRWTAKLKAAVGRAKGDGEV